jgi:carbamoyltransferase
MKILGICNAETASSCLMIDGEIISAVSEERFSRVKMDDSFPRQSIEFCLSNSGITISDVDVIAYSWSKGLASGFLENYMKRLLELYASAESKEVAMQRVKWEIYQDKKRRDEFEEWVNQNIDRSSTIVLDYYHHEAHAASAAYFSPFDSGMVLTCDGRGDFESSTIWNYSRGDAESLRKIYSASSFDSFGYYYGRITGLLGFKPMRHEGKITGLAAYGNKKVALSLCEKMIGVDQGVVRANLGLFYSPFMQPYSKELLDHIKKYKPEDVAASAQFHLENMLCSLIDFYLGKEGGDKTNVMLAGGVFGNVKATQEIKKLQKVKNVYVQPQMGDGGLCLGASALAFIQTSKLRSAGIKPLTTVYLGPAVTQNDSYRLDELLISDYTFDEAVKEICNNLSQNRVIGLMQNRMEFGPRALCNRSIIYKTSDISANSWLNHRMNRTEFMPFAPVIREEVAHSVISNYDPKDITLKFMTATVNCTNEFSKRSPAVVHVDKTARPQIVTQHSNHFIWSILVLWEKVSNELSLINTSFNAHEEPIVCSINEGIDSLLKHMVDELWVIGEGSIKKYTCITS